MASIVDLTRRVADVRSVRVAAFFPRVLAVVFLFVAPVAYLANSEGRTTIGLIVASAVCWLVSALIAQGALWAVVCFAVASIAVVVAALVGGLSHRSDPGFWFGVAGSALLLVPAALAIRSIPASARLRTLRRHGSAAWPASTRTLWSRLPADRRMLSAATPIFMSVACYVVGAVIGLAFAAVTGSLLLGSLAFLPFAWVGARLNKRAQRLVALRAQEVRAADIRPPVLLLRSFGDDNLPLERSFQMIRGLLREELTFEEFVVDRLWTLGPVIAIGKPGEKISPVGAAREYVHGPNWQQRVEAVLGECSWVVSILGDGAGLLWEYQQIQQRGLDERLVLVVPPYPLPTIVNRWHAFQHAFAAAARVDLQLEPDSRHPLVVMFSRAQQPVLFYCKFQNETAFTAAFDELYAHVGARARNASGQSLHESRDSASS
jgi:hypothetical protein